MLTVKQTALVNELLSRLSCDEVLLCEPVIKKLLEIGYIPVRHKKSTFVIKFDKLGRTIAKLEVGHDSKLSFWLRFSASSQYSKTFQDAVNHRNKAWILRGQDWQPIDIESCCGLCKGNPQLYHYVRNDGTSFEGCGGYTKHVHGVTYNDVPEILQMIKEQDNYFNEMLDC